MTPITLTWDVATCPAPVPSAPEVDLVAQARFDGRADQIAAVRRLVADCLPPACPAEAADDVVLCTCEIASNAVLHSRSGAPGGAFLVRVEVGVDFAAVTVLDQGPSLVPNVPRNGEGGRGLAIVADLADAYELTRPQGPDGPRSVWFRKDWTPGAGTAVEVTP